MRMIDADSLQRRICGAKCGCEYEDCGNEVDCGYDHFISNSPTINAVPVVRCRECKHYDTADFDGDILCGCTLHSAMLDITPDSFCSYGERKEGADNEP